MRRGNQSLRRASGGRAYSRAHLSGKSNNLQPGLYGHLTSSDALDLLDSRERPVIADTMPETLDALVHDWHERFEQGEDAAMIARRVRDVAELNERPRGQLFRQRPDEGPSA
jgi:hypothetical protein